jgi:nucleoside-diphosphate-sugar epimerase
VNPTAVDLIRKDCVEVLEGRVQALAPLKGEKVVITGGTGFLGTWLVEMLACLNDVHKFGVRIQVLARGTERFKTEKPHLGNRSDLTLTRTDVRHLAELPKDTQWLIHAAGNPDNRYHSTKPIETMRSIADGTASVLQAIDRCGEFKMMLNVSSGLVYGPQPSSLERVPESFVGASPFATVSSVYTEAKRYAETLCGAARSQARVPVVTARPFAFIGPYQSLETPWAVNSFIRDALLGNPIRVLGDGQTVRSYMYPSDAAYWLLRILTGASSGESYNLGSPEAITLERVATTVAGHFRPSPEVRLRTSNVESPAHSRLVPDVTSAAERLQLGLTVGFESAIQKTIHWNQKNS